MNTNSCLDSPGTSYLARLRYFFMRQYMNLGKSVFTVSLLRLAIFSKLALYIRMVLYQPNASIRRLQIFITVYMFGELNLWPPYSQTLPRDRLPVGA